MLILLARASDPEEIYKIHELKVKKEEAEKREANLDQLIQMCKAELSLLTENQENWQYPLKWCDFSIPNGLGWGC